MLTETGFGKVFFFILCVTIENFRQPENDCTVHTAHLNFPKTDTPQKPPKKEPQIFLRFFFPSSKLLLFFI